jgi:hypothetical protein
VQRLHELAEQLDDRALLTMTVTTYLNELGPRRAAIADALARHDRDALRAAAHTLKSSSALLGADGLAAACAEAERRASEAPVEELAALVRLVERGSTGVAAALGDYLAAPAGG